MNGLDVKEAMEQVHITENMQEEIIMNVQKQMKNGNYKRRNWKKMATVAAAFALTAGAVSIPAHAVVKNVILARMQDIPKAELQDIRDAAQTQHVAADSFSREYSDIEKTRMKELNQSYQDGTFPEKTILQVEDESDITQGTLCYNNKTACFYLPDRELTDEELLEIIDFNYTRSYAFTQSQEAQDARKQYQAQEAQYKKQIQDAGGLSKDEALEIATKRMKSKLGTAAEGMDDVDVSFADISDEDIKEMRKHMSNTDCVQKGDIAYLVSFGNPDDRSSYTCMVDSLSGDILGENEYRP